MVIDDIRLIWNVCLHGIESLGAVMQCDAIAFCTHCLTVTADLAHSAKPRLTGRTSCCQCIKITKQFDVVATVIYNLCCCILYSRKICAIAWFSIAFNRTETFFPKFFFLSFISWWWRISVCVLVFLFGTPSERCSVFHLFQLFARTTMRKHELMILYTAIMGSVVCLWKFITIIFRICYSLDDKVKTATYNWRYEKKFILFQTKWLLEYWVFGLIVWSVFLTIGASWVHRE